MPLTEKLETVIKHSQQVRYRFALSTLKRLQAASDGDQKAIIGV